MTGRLLVFLVMGALAMPAFAQAPVQLYPRATPGAQAPASEPARPVAPPAEPAVPPLAVPSEPRPAAPKGIAVTPLPPAPAAPPPPAPAAVQPTPPPPMAPPPMAPNDAVLAAVEGFYGALAHGDGQRANEFLLPEKRNQGAYEIAAMTRFYSAMREPLQLIGVGRLDPEVVRVRYAYTHQSGRHCDGVADVTVRRIDGRGLIERIRPLSGC
ncbi:hypothetical protein [Azospirillum sp. TSO22-1]|uniref:hypothetical protein n=1 Tax=Azospirillum sp. TSO22-1 TaxID=716789 RepID=UPI000D65BF1B|nr:hypothetical protein [Azospirillum sp. TSO22-1]